MAKAPGIIDHPSGRGGTAGWVGDLPIAEAIAAVQEGRVHLDRAPWFAVDVEHLLAGLGVGSLRELRTLVEAGRAALPACGVCGSHDDVQFRGWTDEGSPMATCASCGGPEAVPGPDA